MNINPKIFLTLSQSLDSKGDMYRSGISMHKDVTKNYCEVHLSLKWFISPDARMSDHQDSGIRIHVYGYLCILERSQTQPGFNQVQSGMVRIPVPCSGMPPDRSHA